MSGCNWYASDDADDHSDCGKPVSHIRAGLRLCDEHVTEWDAGQEAGCPRCGQGFDAHGFQPRIDGGEEMICPVTP